MYLTGSILPADRVVVVRHLASCAACRSEVADLAGLPGLLRRPACQDAAEIPGPDRPLSGNPARLSGDPPLLSGDSPLLSGDPASGGGPAPGGTQLSRLMRTVARRRRRRRWLLALAVAVLAVVAGTGWALRLAQPPGSGTQTMTTVLETNRVGGVTVLTDAEGYTLYWFSPDKPTMSACEASCARTWPPVTAPAVGGAGVTGTLGAIPRPDGSLQATYDGHPLYTTTADKLPGQAKGNGVRDNGGQWHEVVMSDGPAPRADPCRRPLWAGSAEDTFPSSGVHSGFCPSMQVIVSVTRNMEHGDRHQELCAVRDRIHPAA